MFDFEEHFKNIDDRHRKREREFEKLALDPPCQEAKVGDRVLLSAGPLGMGFDWIRLEATILEVADTAYYVRFKDKKKFGTKEPEEMWVHRFVVTDVLTTYPIEKRDE